MAYHHKFNPDALPAHAEPNQAAQILAQAQAQKDHSHNPTPQPQQQQHPQRTPPSASPRLNPQSSYQNKPPPPLPPLPNQQQQQSQQPTDPYYRPHSTSNASFRPHSSSTPRPLASPQNSYNSKFQSSTPQPAGSYNTPPVPGAYPQPQQQQQHGQGIGSVQQPPAPRSNSHSPRPPTGAGSDPSLWPLFRAVDVNGTGQLGEPELSKALMNDKFTSFDPVTVRLMIKMFDQNHNGGIGFEEFCGLWSFLAAWRSLFRRFDEDRSGYISFDEYSKALVAFGYNLSAPFVEMMYRIYDKRGDQSMSFDLFVQSCISLKRMTDVFKRYDADRDGFITLSFEEFLSEILNQR